MAEPVANGTRVRYHGSLKDNAAFRLGVSDADDSMVTLSDVVFIVENKFVEPYPDNEEARSADNFRYVLVPADPAILVGDDKKTNYLWNVRVQSFTVIEGAS
jgi:hypothetical protein